MKKLTIILMACAFLAAGSMTAYGGEQAPAKVKSFAHNVLAKFGSDSVIVNAVKAENAKKKTLEKVKEIDQKWINTIGTDDFIDSLMNSACSQHLNNIKKENDFYEEIFVVDNLGANVALTDKTSDYWQGDEAKFTKSYKEGAGDVFISDVSFDDSTQSYLTQVSVPVMGEGKVIGVIIFGINVDKLN
ncbi:MAG: cache domain-containing protein [Deltaproteobacteria bacterium]|nr:cache domain-containing protein [Deltaproteobacteria bacterium]MBW1845634.1 cache domain-containing protein [Deltaproteobacteria bacterium]MBW1985577.1 cache domain-containing protein [Deltaproteobacteria bacterium]MBW2178840.1 cache domain-containing protein [Deltaproteobacteria bacterium]